MKEVGLYERCSVLNLNIKTITKCPFPLSINKKSPLITDALEVQVKQLKAVINMYEQISTLVTASIL